MGHGRKKFIFRLQPFPAIVLFLLAVSLYLPQLVPTIPLNGIRSLLTAALVFLTVISLYLLRMEPVKSIPWYPWLLSLLFPIYLSFHGFVNGNIGLALFGNSDRSLGAITYFACSCFFVFGYLLKKAYPDSLVGIFSYIGIFQLIVFATRYFGQSNDARQGSFFNSNPNSILTGLILVFLLTWLVEEKLSIQHPVVASAFIFSSLLLIWISALQAIIGFLLTLFMYGFMKFARKSVITFNSIVTALVVMSTIFIVFCTIAKLPTKEESNGSSWNERLEIYKTSFKIISEDSLFGIGVDHFNLGYYKWSLLENVKLVDNAHSIPLQLLSTIGILGCIVFYWLFFTVLRGSYVVPSLTSSSIRNSILFYLISGLFGIQNPSVEFIIFLLLGFLANSNHSKTSKKLGKRSAELTLVVTVLAGLLFVSFHLYPFIKTSLALSDSSRNLERSNLQIRQNIEKVYDLGLLNTAGRYSVFINDKDLGLVILQRMKKISDIDQRTIALALVMGEKYDDKNLENLGEQLNTLARIKNENS